MLTHPSFGYFTIKNTKELGIMSPKPHTFAREIFIQPQTCKETLSTLRISSVVGTKGSSWQSNRSTSTPPVCFKKFMPRFFSIFNVLWSRLFSFSSADQAQTVHTRHYREKINTRPKTLYTRQYTLESRHYTLDSRHQTPNKRHKTKNATKQTIDNQ